MTKEKTDILDSIAKFNQSYLRLAQLMLREDRENGKRMLGVSDSMANHICSLTPPEIEALADSAELICQFRESSAPGHA